VSAELLRRAAAVLRERANNDLTPGDWIAAYDKAADEHWVRGKFGATVAMFAEDYTSAPRDSAYVALMHPPVALALADHLSRAADTWEVVGSDYTAPEFGAESLVTLAREILRDDES
jgi:hypothetical protein